MSSKINICKGIGWNAINSFFRVILGILSTVILSRMLSPSDFGIFGVLMIFITVSELLADSGMAGYIVRTNNLHDNDYDTLFVYNFTVSLLLYMILYLIAPWIAAFYNNDVLILGTRLSCIVVVFQSVSIIANANLLRNLAFKELAIISIISSMLGLIAAIIWAYYIGDFFALVMQSLVSVFINSAGQLWITKTIPHFHFNFGCFKKQFAFGINLMGSTILQSFSSNISTNIIAKIFNVNLAGVFIQSSKLQNVSVSLIQGVIDRTFFPTLSKISSDLDSFILESRKLNRMSCAIFFPLFTFVVILAEPIVIILLGEQWIECVTTFQLFMVGAFPALIKILNRNVLKALGHTRDIFIIDFLSFIFFALSLFLSVYLKNYMLFVVFVLMYNFLSAFISIEYISKRFNMSIMPIVKDSYTYIPFLLISIVDLFINDYGIMYYIINFACIAILFFMYFVFKNQEYLKLQKYFHL